MRQLNLDIEKARLVFGGAGLKSSPKTARPIDTKSATHLTLKCTRGILRLPKTFQAVNQIVHQTCVKYDFTLYKYSNNFNHLHILIRVTHRYVWRKFIRELTGRIAQLIKKLTGFDGLFWLGRPFTRIIKGWGKNFKCVKEYIELNILEAMKGLTCEQARGFQRLRREFGS